MHQEISITPWDVYRRYWNIHAGNVGARQAVTHLSSAAYWEHYRVIFDRLVHFTPAKVIDLACGPALLLKNLTTYWPGLDYLGLDISHEMIAAAKAGNEGGRFVLLEEPTIPECCDLLLCHSLFTHISEADTRHYLDEIGKAIAPDGLAIVSIHTDCEEGVKGNVNRVDYEPGYFEQVLSERGFIVDGYVDTSIQRYYAIRGKK
jgi:SAM-dependent methyltransferase